jgi:hypothetical protein
LFVLVNDDFRVELLSLAESGAGEEEPLKNVFKDLPGIEAS